MKKVFKRFLCGACALITVFLSACSFNSALFQVPEAKNLDAFFNGNYAEVSLAEAQRYASQAQETSFVNAYQNDKNLAIEMQRKGILSENEVGEKVCSLRLERETSSETSPFRLLVEKKEELIAAPYGERDTVKSEGAYYDNGDFGYLKEKSESFSSKKEEKKKVASLKQPNLGELVEVPNLKDLVSGLTPGGDYSLGSIVTGETVKIKYERTQEVEGKTIKTKQIWAYDMSAKFIAFGETVEITYPDRAKLDYNGETTFYSMAYVMPFSGKITPPNDLDTYQ